MSRKTKLEKQETSLFLLISVRSIGQDWTRPDDEPRTVLYKHSNRPDHDCIYYFSLRRAQDTNVVFHESSSDAVTLYDDMPTSAPDKVVTFASEDLFQKKPQI